MKINCEFISTNHLYVCFVRLCSIKTKGTEITEFVGTHKIGRQDRDVNYLIFMSPIRMESGLYLEGWSFDDTNVYCEPPVQNVVEYIPKNLNIFFPRLKKLQIINCGLKSIERNDLITFRHLEWINFSYNNLVTIPTDLFVNMHRLNNIGLSYNQIEYINSKVFTPILNNIPRYVGLSKNRGINQIFDPQERTHSLKHLMLTIDRQCKEPLDEPKTNPIDYKHLWLNTNSSDFIIDVGSFEFHVHQEVLANRSTFFENMFRCIMLEKQEGRMRIYDFSPRAVEEFLRHLYTDEAPKPTNVLELYALSDKYQITKLQSVYQDIIIDNIDETNVLQVFKFADLYSNDIIKSIAFAEIKMMHPGKRLPVTLLNNLEELEKILETHDNLQM